MYALFFFRATFRVFFISFFKIISAAVTTKKSNQRLPYMQKKRPQTIVYGPLGWVGGVIALLSLGCHDIVQRQDIQ